MARYANGEIASTKNTHEGFTFSHIASIGWKALGWRLRGDHRRSPFFDAGSGKPVATPRLEFR